MFNDLLFVPIFLAYFIHLVSHLCDAIVLAIQRRFCLDLLEVHLFFLGLHFSHLLAKQVILVDFSLQLLLKVLFSLFGLVTVHLIAFIADLDESLLLSGGFCHL